MKPGPPLRYRFLRSSLARRPSFWLGLFVACFLAWAWWDSTRQETWLQMQVSSGTRGLIRLDGTTFVFDHVKHFLAWEGVMRFGAQTTAEDFEEVNLEDWNVRYFKIPDSLVFFSFLGLWVGWLAFPAWLRKKRQAGKGALP